MARSSRFPGITTSAGPADLSPLVEDKDGFICERREADHAKGAEQAGTTLLRGAASFLPSGQEHLTLIVADGDGSETSVTAEHVLIGTGAEPLIPDITGLDDVDYLTSSTAMSLDRVPESLLVIGASGGERRPFEGCGGQYADRHDRP